MPKSLWDKGLGSLHKLISVLVLGKEKHISSVGRMDSANDYAKVSANDYAKVSANDYAKVSANDCAKLAMMNSFFPCNGCSLVGDEMRQFYLSKNKCGYYLVKFVNPKTGKPMNAKSTHTKDLYEAMRIANEWQHTGVPSFRTNSRFFQNGTASSEIESNLDLKSFVTRLSDSDVPKLLQLLIELRGVDFANLNVQIASQPQISVSQTQQQQKKDFAVSGATQNSPSPQNAQEPSPAHVQNPKAIPQKQFPVATNKKISATQTEKLKADSSALPEKLTQENGLCKFIESFWDYDTSRYIAEQRALGKKMTQKHCKEMYQIVSRHWRPYFGDDITAEMLDTETLMDFFFYLHFDKDLAGATVNKAINCGKKAVEYLYKKKLIPENPFLGVERFAPNGIERGIPTETEVKELMALDWESKVGKLAFTLSTFTGLRAGEISGLQVCDIDLDAELLHLRHSWNVVDKLKGLKNGETRSVPCDRETLMMLLIQARRNPMYSDTSFVFWSTQKPEQPFHPNYYEEPFYESLQKIGVSEEQRKERVLVFHSLRHFCATLLRQRMDLATVQEILGHKSEIMTKHYSDHESKTKFAIMRDALSKSKDAILKSA